VELIPARVQFVKFLSRRLDRGLDPAGLDAEGRLLDDSADEFEGFGGFGLVGQVDAGCLDQAALDGIERVARASEDDEQILPGDGTVGGMNEIPPTADGILDFGFCFFAHYQGVDQPVDLALNGLIGDRNFLGHEFGASRYWISNRPAKP